MNASNYFILNRVFTRNIFKELIEERTEGTYVTAIKRYINDSEDKNNQQLISEIYNKLKKNYRNEYFYKNTLLNKLLLGVHSPKTTVALTEVPVFKSKADFILINGKAVVYEIKTELDNFERLDTQLNDYYKAFNHVSVVTCESNYQTIEKKLSGTPVGIYLLTNRTSLSEKKKPMENNACLDLNIVFEILRKSEYESILMSHFGQLPNVSQFKYHSTCKQMFCQMDTAEAYQLFLKQLKRRNKIDIDLYATVPYELKFLMYFSNLKKRDYQNLKIFLESKFGG
ncbi:sce7726 family protein [Clostridium estertheticum]|uniref:sce7726 family protein n=1 Tax=Clostridium estertheticum TaxID=238834 RepID=UPI001C0B538F|nr:sce7726 family protein [Clostridium estertheticum]MBU3175174.1 sce7726 family protein [Clostridium estertheticum]